MVSRIEQIRQKIQNERKVIVSDLSKTYKVTEETIRRDLEKLEAEGFATRTFGGAILNVDQQKENVQFHQRASIHLEEKQKIAATVADMLNAKRTIAADASTTVMEAIKLVRGNRNLTLLTASTEIFHEVPGAEFGIISTGGVFNELTLSLQGKLAKENIKRYHVDVALVSCRGLDIQKGIMDSSEPEAEVKQEMVQQASEVILLADHTKFNRTAFVKFLDWRQLDCLVTDQRPEGDWVSFCAHNSIKLIY